MKTTNLTRLETLTAIGRQILSMLESGAVDIERAEFCTAGKFSTDDIRAALNMLHAAGLTTWCGGKYHAAE